MEIPRHEFSYWSQWRDMTQQIARGSLIGDIEAEKLMQPSRTAPSLPPDPTRLPRGVATEVSVNPKTTRERENARDIELENNAAAVLARAGFDIERNPTLTEDDFARNPTLDSNRKPDYRVEGEVFDCYSPRGSRALNIFVNLDKKLAGQATRIVLNLEQSGVSIDELKEVLAENPLKLARGYSCQRR